MAISGMSEISRLVPFDPHCDGCGQRDQEVDKLIRLEKLRRHGQEPMEAVGPFRFPKLCDRCLELLPLLFGNAQRRPHLAVAEPPDGEPLDANR